MNLSIMEKIIRAILIIITLCSASSCNVNKTSSTLLWESQRRCLKENQTRLEEKFDTYQNIRCKKNLNHIIDSLVTSISSENEKDTIYVIESCNPPLYVYYAFIWNKDSAFTLQIYPVLIKKGVPEIDKELLRIIEKWDENEIISKSHEKSLHYQGNWDQTSIASRLIMVNGKCEIVESIYFFQMDLECKDVPVILW